MRYFSRSHNRGQNLRPPDLYEYSVDNFWFKTADLHNQKINNPLRGSHKANDFTSHFIVNRKIPYAGSKNLQGIFGKGIK